MSHQCLKRAQANPIGASQLCLNFNPATSDTNILKGSRMDAQRGSTSLILNVGASWEGGGGGQPQAPTDLPPRRAH
jgi:hypothetical protein